MIRNLHITRSFTRSLAMAAFAIFMMTPGRGWGQTTYNLCTSTTDLVSGAKYIIVSGQSGTVAAMGYQNTNNRTQATTSYTVSAGSISATPATTSGDLAKAYEITLGGTAGAWTLQDIATNIYLQATSSSANYLKSGNGTWTISFSSNAAVITCTNGGTNNILRYNSSSTLYSCYSSTGSTASVYLYKAAGATKPEPSNQVTNFTKGTLTTTTLPLTWTAAAAGTQAPDGYLLKLNASTITDPVDATDPGAGALAISSGAATYKVASAATTSATFTSAIAGTMYNVKIYSYTNSGSLIDFKTTSVPSINYATLPAAVTSPALTTTGTTTANITWSLPGSYVAGNHSTLVFVKATSAVIVGTPTSAPSTYTANTAFASGTVYQGDAAAYCVYNGDGTSVSITGLSVNSTYYVLIYTVVDASNSDATNSYSATATTSGLTAKIEPTNQPTAFAVGAVTTSNIPLTWVAAVTGSQAPDGYLVKLSTSTIADPADGTDPADVVNVSGGIGNKKVAGTSYSSFTNWTAGTMYNFKIYSYTNTGVAIDFNITSPPSISYATLPAAVTGTSFSATGTTNANIAWSLPGTYNSGNHSTLVFVKAGSSVTAGTPTNAPSTYTANTTFGSGTAYQNDGSASCVFNGDGSNVIISGLNANSSYYVLIYTVVDASNSNSTNSYSASATPSGTTAKIEPTNQVTAFAVGGVTTSAIPLNWTPAVAGSQAPDKYLIKLNTAPNPVIDPVDGIDPADITTIAGGVANKKTTDGTVTSTTTFSGMTAGTMYNYKIYSLTNSGTNINFNTLSPPSLNQATLPNAATTSSLIPTGSTTANISWTAASGYNSTNHSTLVFVKSASAVTQLTPTNAPSTYTANTIFGSGTVYQNDASASCVYNGDGTSVAISGLNANSTYYVLIYTAVDASNSNSTNSYSAALTANGTTYKIAVSVPYSQTFEGTTSEWTLFAPVTNYWAIGSATNNGGTNALYISNDNGVSNAYTNTTAQAATDAYFRIDLTGQTSASLSFDWKSNGEIGYDYGEVYINTGGSDILISAAKEFKSTTTFANKFISLTPYIGSEVTIKFRWVNDGSGGTTLPFAVDNISVVSGDLATLSTTSASSITVNGASTGGNIANDGGSSVTRGVCYGTSTNPTIAGSKTTDGTGTGTFTSTLSGLIDNTIYYVRAYATNSTGTAYGNETNFTTSSVSAPTATPPTNVGSNGFVANWNSVTGGNSYKLDVSTNSVFSINNLSENFSKFTAGSVVLPDAADISGSLDTYLQTTGWVGSKLYQAGGLIKFGSNSVLGYIITKTVDLSSNSGNATLTFDLLQLGSDVNPVQVFHAPDGTTFTQIGSDIIPPSTIATQTFNITGGTANSKIKISAKVAANNRFFIDNLIIRQNTNLPGYDNLNIPSGTSQSVSGLSPNSTYYYQVRAVGGNSTSANSTPITVLTAPAAAVANAAASVTKTGFTASWNAPAGATGYKLDVATNSGFTTFVSGYNNQDVGNVTNLSISSLNPGTQYWYRVRAYNASATGDNSNVVTFSTFAPTTSTFTTSGVWSDAANWDPGIPDAGTNAIISATAIVDANATCYNLTISPTGTLTNTPTKVLTVKGNLLIQSGGSLISEAADLAVTGTSSVVLTITGASGDWHLLSSPVAGQEISGDFTPTGTYADVTGYDFYAWDEPSLTWVNRKNTIAQPNGDGPRFDDAAINNGLNFNIGKGYLVTYEAANPTKTFTGTLNSGAILFPLTATATNTYAKSNLTGNPYPSSIDWRTGTWGKSNLRTESGGGHNMYIWKQSASNYGVYNDAASGDGGTNSVTRYIAPMQGFYVMASTAGSLTFNNDSRFHNGQTWLKSSTADELSLRLKVTAPENKGSDEIALEFGHASSEGGAAKWFSFVATAPSLYTPKAGTDYSISFLTSVSDNPVIPVSFKAGTDGEYSLSANMQLPANTSVILKDNKLNQTQNLTDNPVYTFTSAPGDDANRFELSFLDVTAVPAAGKDNFSVYFGNGTINILSGLAGNTEIRVSNMLGQVVLRGTTNGNSHTTLNTNSLQNGVYILSLVGNGKVVSRKVVVSK